MCLDQDSHFKKSHSDSHLIREYMVSFVEQLSPRTAVMQCRHHILLKGNQSVQKLNYTFFSSAHGTLSRTDHVPGHKTSLNKFENRNEAFFHP